MSDDKKKNCYIVATFNMEIYSKYFSHEAKYSPRIYSQEPTPPTISPFDTPSPPNDDGQLPFLFGCTVNPASIQTSLHTRCGREKLSFIRSHVNRYLHKHARYIFDSTRIPDSKKLFNFIGCEYISMGF